MISIIFPFFNRTEETAIYLKSIYTSQLEDQIEIILVNNNSLPQKINKIKKEFPQVKIIDLKKNLGPGQARNIGASYAQGEFLFFSDDDQILEPQCLSIMKNFLVKNTWIKIVGATIMDRHNREKIVSCGYELNHWLFLENGQRKCQEIKVCDWVEGCALMIRKVDFFQKNGFGKQFIFFGEDADLCLKMKKGEVVNLPKAKVFHGEIEKKKKSAIESFKSRENYYVAKFKLINLYSHGLKKMTSLFFHLTLCPITNYLKGKKDTPLFRLKCLIKSQENEK